MRHRVVLSVLVIAALSACRPRVPPAPPPPPPVADVQEASLAGGFITARIEIPRQAAGPKPVVISPVFDHDALLEAGAVVVTYQIHWQSLAPPQPEAPPTTSTTAPPNTVGKWLLASPSPKTVGQGYFALIEYNAEHAVSTVIDHLVTLPDVDPGRIGIAGNSTNGLVALQATAADRRIAVTAVLVACGDYHGFLRDSDLAMNGRPLDLDSAYDRHLRAHEPITHPRRLVHAAILMVNGSDDHTVPLSCAIRTVDVLRRAYARAGVPERFRFVALKGGHNIGELARAEIMAWWYRWLLRPAPPPAAARRDTSAGRGAR